jgi:hypothetical protein
MVWFINHHVLINHQQNGIAERKHSHIIETARTLLPLRFWGNVVLTANYLINRMPSLDNKVPHSLIS